MSRVIAVDLDDVIIDTFVQVAAFHNANYGTSLTRDDIFTVFLKDVWHCTAEEAVRRDHEYATSEYCMAAQPVAGAVEGLRTLREAGYSIIFVTGRSDNIIPQTEAWLATHVPGLYDGIHYTHHFDAAHHAHRTKADVCQEIGAALLIEDAPHHAEGVAAVGIPALLLDAPWNQVALASPLITRVYSWGEIVAWIKANLK